MEYTNLSDSTIRVSRMGLGCWAIGGHGWGEVDEQESIQAVRHALDRGVTLYDTADVYGFGHSETLLRKALGDHCRQVVVSTKFGVRWDESGKTWKDASPSSMHRALEASLRRLGLDCIPLYYVHWPDGKTPIEDTLAGLDRARAEGKIGAIGVSNFSPAQLRAALTVATVQAAQVQMNVIDCEQAHELLPLCREHSIPLITWGSLADGLLTGKFRGDSRFPANDHRSRYPNFQGDLFRLNLQRVEVLRQIADRRRVTVAQVALRWLLDTAGVGSVLFGAKRASQIDENLGALEWRLTAEDSARIEALCMQHAPAP